MGKKLLIKEEFQNSKNLFSLLWEKKKILIPSLILIFFAAFFVFAREEEQIATAEKNIFTAKNDDLRIFISADGSVVNATSVKMSFLSSGKVSEVFVEEGQEVKTGEKIAQLDTSELDFDLKIAETNLAVASANLQAKAVGSTPAEIELARQTVTSAQENVTETERQNNLDEQNAQLNVENQEILLKSAKAESEGGAKVDESEIKAAEVAMEVAKNELETAKVEVENDWKKNISDGALAISQSLPILEQALAEADFLLEVDTDESDVDLLGFSDENALRQTKDLYRQTKSSFENFVEKNKSRAGVFSEDESEILREKISEITEIAKNVSKVLHGTAEALDNTPSADSQEKINAAKLNISNWNTKVKTEISDLTKANQNISDAEIAKTSRISDAENKFATAEITFEKAKIAFETGATLQDEKVLSAEKQLENAKLQLENVKNKNVAALRNAESQLALAEAQLRIKTEPLRPEDIAALRAQITQAENQKEEVLYKIENSTLFAPIDGKIGVINVQPGEYFTNDKDSFFTTIVNKENFGIEVFVEEIDITKIKVGQAIIATMDAIEGVKLKGVVNFIDNSATIDSNGIVSYLVRISLENAANLPLKDKMTAYVDFIIAEANKVVVVPVSAVKNIDGVPSVQMAENDEWKLVTTGFTDGEMVEIISGIDAGQKVLFSE